MNPIVISLGAWCRPAYHIRNYFGYDRAFPHDWNITSYRALLHTLADGYDPSRELALHDCVLNQFDSATDEASGVVYQHDLHRDQLETDGKQLTDSAANRAVLDQTRGKAAVLHRRMKEVASSGPVIFLRWIREGHPDGEWNDAFEGETAAELYSELIRYCGHDRVKLLHVVTREREVGAPHLTDFQFTEFGAEAIVHEAPGGNWTGDAQPWHALLERVEQEWGDL